ncbi:hypothetical protein PIIN_08538 [Serendipita indica DSM 11827]|uniref:Uncharacterized protein n=1 Tax=Serendipita indica (strain DSM 11827) TaxID=1109443 RepID=G4TTE3_SERID|nr:hypothetical protein PIIN_08538 [Serendipita indica DSM 11827]
MPHIGRHILGRASNKTKRDLENELWNLSKRITNQEQFELYTNRVSQLRGLQENLRYIRSRELLELVRQLKDRVDLLTLDQTLVSHDACKDIIKEEFRRLNQLKVTYDSGLRCLMV